MFGYAKPKQQKDAVQRQAEQRPNATGIPVAMKERFENQSGFSFDDVRVHYNSSKPKHLQALAYTQGNQVFIGPGQEKHLPHELGHVVQQKAGLVRPTGSIGGLPVNDDAGLEMAADKVVQMKNDTIQFVKFIGDPAVIHIHAEGRRYHVKDSRIGNASRVDFNPNRNDEALIAYNALLGYDAGSGKAKCVRWFRKKYGFGD